MNVTVINHPLVRHKLTLMREADCSTYKFRTLTTELARLMAYEASRDFEIEKYIIDGWCGSIEGDRIKGKTLTVVPILLMQELAFQFQTVSIIKCAYFDKESRIITR